MVRKTSDDLRRATEQARAVRQVLDRYPVDVVAAEMASTTPYTYPTFSFGVGIEILASISHPIIEVLPYEVKVAAAGSNRATKREIIEWAIHQPSSKPVKWPTSRRTNNLNLPYGDKYIAKIAEHPADALAAIRAAFLTDQWRLAHKLVPSGAGLEERSGRDEQPCCT